MITYKCFYGDAPAYLKDLITPSQSLKNFMDVVVPKSLTQYGDRAFGRTGPRAWNALPLGLRCQNNITIFKKELKHILFNNSELILKKIALH